MSEFFGEETREATTEPLSVSAAMALAKRSLEACTVRLIGEVSELSNKAGYKAVYFSVKDAGASLPCMMWLNRYRASGVELRVGMLVEISGRFTLYAPKGRMNFDVHSICVAGQGDLRLKVAALAKKLEAEGLMRPERKRALPVYPARIGVVTSPRGAAVHDVLRTLRRRFPLAEVVLAGVPVEGEHAPAGLIEGLHTVTAANAEVVLLVRGGGSFEDLMPFNDEALARAIASMPVPVVTGIGHEPDTSIADMVADVRASTPTAAAETVSPAPESLQLAFRSHAVTMATSCMRSIETQRARFERYATRPLFTDPALLFAQDAQTIDFLEDRLHRAIPASIARDAAVLERMSDRMHTVGESFVVPFQNSIALRASRLHDLSPLTVLARGYSMVTDSCGNLVKSAAGRRVGEDIHVELADGTLDCEVRGVQLVDKETVSISPAAPIIERES